MLPKPCHCCGREDAFHSHSILELSEMPCETCGKKWKDCGEGLLGQPRGWECRFNEVARIDGEWLEFKREGTDYYHYDIPLRRLRGGAALYDWLLHMAEKNWVDERHLLAIVSAWGLANETTTDA